MKRAFSSRESSRKLLTCDPKTILQLMDEFSSEEDSELEFDGYITDENVKDEVDCKNDASNRFFFQNEPLHTDSALLLVVRANHLQPFSHQIRLSHYSRLYRTMHLQIPAPLQLLAAHFPL